MPATTRALAQFATATRFADLPEAVRREGARAFLNWVGCALGGSRHEAADVALATFSGFSGPAKATVIGRGKLLDGLHAAFQNCLASSAWAFDDTHLRSVIHPSGPVAAPLLALAERQPLAGEALVTALVLGIELTCRLGNAIVVPPAKGHVGWYATGVMGGIGGAVASAKVLGLDERRMVSAIGAAAMQASGFREGHGTMSTSFVPAHAARCGMQAALLAANGFVCAETAIEGPIGYAAVFGNDAPNLAAATDGLGTHWEMLANAYKPYPCGIVIHPVIDACLELARSGAFAPDGVERVRLSVNPLCLTLCDRPEPKGNLDGQVSVQHWTAATLIHRAAGLKEVSDAAVRDPAVVALRRRVETERNEAVGRDQAIVTVTLKNGRVLEERVEKAIGSLERPMTDGELEDKFRAQAEGIIPDAQARTLADLCWRVAELDDVAPIAELSFPPG